MTDRDNDLPSTWTWITFKDAVENISTNNKKIKQKDYLALGKFPIVDQGQSLIGGYTNDDSKVIFSQRPLIIFGDHTKTLKFISQNFAPGADGVKVLAPQKFFEPKLFLYFTQYLVSSLVDNGYARHYQHLEKCSIPLPPINEQKRIITKIEELFYELDEGLASLDKAHELLRVYQRTLLKNAFEGKLTEKWREEDSCALVKGKAFSDYLIEERQKKWPKGEKYKDPIQSITLLNFKIPKDWAFATLDMLCNIKGGLTVDAKREITDPIEIPYLRVANVQDGYLDIQHIKTIKAARNKVDQLLLKEGDVLFTEGGDIDKLGRGWVWEGQIQQCTHQNHIFRARPYSQSINSKYISYYCNVFGKAYFLKEGKQTTNLASIGLNKLRAFPIAIPCFEEQMQIVTSVDEMLSKINNLEQSIATQISLGTFLRQSVLKKAFSGELVSQDTKDEPASQLLDRIKSGKNDQKSRTVKPKKMQKAAL